MLSRPVLVGCVRDGGLGNPAVGDLNASGVGCPPDLVPCFRLEVISLVKGEMEVGSLEPRRLWGAPNLRVVCFRLGSFLADERVAGAMLLPVRS